MPHSIIQIPLFDKVKFQMPHCRTAALPRFPIFCWTDIVDGKHVLGAPDEIQEEKNAIEAYRLMPELDAFKEKDLLKAHGLMMKDLVRNAGHYRQEGVGVFDGNGRMGRYWQTILLSRWKGIFAWLPVETIVKENQQDYYNVIAQCDAAGNSTAFVEFMLKCLLDAMENYEDDENEVPHKVQDKVQDKFPEVSQSTWDVLAIIQQNPKATVTDICAKKGLKERQVYKHISILKSLGVIVRVGSNKTGYWKVNI